MNIVKKTFAYPKNRVCKITTICLIGNYKLTLFFLEKSDEVRKKRVPAFLKGRGTKDKESYPLLPTPDPLSPIPYLRLELYRLKIHGNVDVA